MTSCWRVRIYQSTDKRMDSDSTQLLPAKMSICALFFLQEGSDKHHGQGIREIIAEEREINMYIDI